MTTLLSILAVAALFVVFGLLYRHRACGGSCGTCSRHEGPREHPHA